MNDNKTSKAWSKPVLLGCLAVVAILTVLALAGVISVFLSESLANKGDATAAPSSYQTRQIELDNIALQMPYPDRWDPPVLEESSSERRLVSWGGPRNPEYGSRPRLSGMLSKTSRSTNPCWNELASRAPDLGAFEITEYTRGNLRSFVVSRPLTASNPSVGLIRGTSYLICSETPKAGIVAFIEMEGDGSQQSMASAIFKHILEEMVIVALG